MNTLTISPKFQILIPKKTRESMDLHPGEKLEVIEYENRIELVPVRSIKDLKGILKGSDTKITRAKDRL